MKYTPVGVDIAKHVIQIHFINGKRKLTAVCSH